MYRHKIETVLQAWMDAPAHRPLVVKGVRQRGKTSTMLAHPEKYHVGRAVKVGDYNVGRHDRLLTLPTYMTFLLTEF